MYSVYIAIYIYDYCIIHYISDTTPPYSASDGSRSYWDGAGNQQMVLHWPISHAIQTINGLNQVAIPECCRITNICIYALYLCIVIL